MGTWNAFYVRTQNGDGIAAIRERFPDAEIESSSEFIGVRMPNNVFEAPESDLAALSARLGTDVIWLGFQSAVDAFSFHHWHSGRHVRTLVYGCWQERIWERVEGQPEPWERDVIFRQRELETGLRYAASDSERQELQRIWRDGEISPGNEEPNLGDSRECSRRIATHYKFPHYGL